MRYNIEGIAKTLKTNRESKGLSQRALGRKAGVLQTQISKFENGAVDLRLSSLIALARVLDLELTLVPRRFVPAVQSIVKSGERPSAGQTEEMRRARKELARFHETLDNVARQKPGIKELAQLQRYARDLERFQSALPDPKTIRNASKAVQQFGKDKKYLSKLRDTVTQLEKWRNRLAHSSSEEVEEEEPVRPVYSLDEDDSNG